MRHLLFLLSIVCLIGGPALADGDSVKERKVALPAPQPSVVVTVERGVRVWRPLGTTGGVEAGSVWPARATQSYSEGYALPSYGAPVVGIAGGFGGYGGYGSRHGWHGKKNWRGHDFVQGKAAGAWGHVGGHKRMAYAGRHGGKPRGHGHR